MNRINFPYLISPATSTFQPPGLLAFLESKETVSLDDIDRLNTRDNLKMAEEDEEKNKRNQVLETLDRAYKSSVKKVEHLVERHMDVSKKIYCITSLGSDDTEHSCFKPKSS